MATIPETAKRNGFDEWREHFIETFPEIAALLKERGVSFHCENSSAGGLVLVIEHRGDRRFGVTMFPTELRGLRGLKYSVADSARPGDNRAFIDELKRRLGTAGASYEEIYNHAAHDWKAVKRRRGEPIGPSAY
jgi:hypothetical protein